MKINIFTLLFLLVFPLGVIAQSGQQHPVNVYFFWGEGCPHCAVEKPFLESLKSEYPQVEVLAFEVWNSSGNRELLAAAGRALGADVSGVPFTVVGETYFIGWYDEQTTGAAIEQAVQRQLLQRTRDVVGELLDSGTAASEEPQPPVEVPVAPDAVQSTPESVAIPFVGRVDIKHFSLPALTVVLGALDGFNPCAMWTLLFLISLLVGMQDRKRMWILGSAFIIASAAVYFLFMAAWLNLFLFLGFIVWVRIIIGLVALAGGGYNLKEYFTNKEGTCKVAGTKKRQKVFARLTAIVREKQFLLSLGGIILLAVAVNLVELICSAGLPAIYTQVLSLSSLAPWQYYLYILLYIFIFMLDDLFVFFVAMTTLKVAGVTTKYSRWSHLIGGILMLIIGALLIFKPEWLMFG